MLRGLAPSSVTEPTGRGGWCETGLGAGAGCWVLGAGCRVLGDYMGATALQHSQDDARVCALCARVLWTWVVCARLPWQDTRESFLPLGAVVVVVVVILFKCIPVQHTM